MTSWITDQPLSPESVLAGVGSPADGAAVLFLGTVREQNDGRAVTGMRYEAYAEMAAAVLKQIVEEAGEQAGTDRIVAAHRVGELAVGDVSVAVAVSSPHRAPAFEAARYIIEQIKVRLPMWKHEHYVTGDSAWVEGVQPGSRA